MCIIQTTDSLMIEIRTIMRQFCIKEWLQATNVLVFPNLLKKKHIRVYVICDNENITFYEKWWQ